MKEIKELVERIFNSMERDFGYMIASDMGMDASKLSPDELCAIAKSYAESEKPEQTHCYECGQSLS